MALVAVLRPQTETELVIALSILEAYGIETFVHGQHFGSLFPGLQIESYNTRTIMVPEERANEAREALAGSPASGDPSAETSPMPLLDRVRVVLEAALFGWFIPGRRSRK